MGRQDIDENNTDINVTIESETDVEERMPSYSDNDDSKTVKLGSDIYIKEKQQSLSYTEENSPAFEVDAVASIKPQRSHPVESDSEEQKEDHEKMKEVKVLSTKLDKYRCVVCDRNIDSRLPLAIMIAFYVLVTVFYFSFFN